MRELVHDRRHLERERSLVCSAGLTPGLAKALGRMPLDGPVSMRELAALLQVDSSYVTAVVDALEQHGLAARRPHPSDRRVKVVALTPDGLELVRRVRGELDTAPAAFSALSEDEVVVLRDLMRKLQQSAGSRRDPATTVAT
jgi:DNA-binding MarR family transcriptional regulator